MRLFDEKRRLIQVDDVLEFYLADDEAQRFETRVVAMHVFKTFDEMVKALPADRLGYFDVRLEALNQGDHGMYAYYTPEDEALHGVVGIEVEVQHG